MKVDFSKSPYGLVPAIVQDAETQRVLMLGYMNKEALDLTLKSGYVTFFSRSRQILWRKGETSGNYLKLVEVIPDCDNDTLLVKANPAGPVCHTGSDTCFNETNTGSFIFELEKIVKSRKEEMPEGSYTASLFKKGMPRIAQKVGEEAVEVVVEGMRNEDERLKEETADLIFHLIVLLRQRGLELNDIGEILRKRHAR